MTSQRPAVVVRAATALGAACALLATPTAAQAQDTAADHPATQAALEKLQAKGGPGAGVYAGDGAGSWNLSVGTGAVNTVDPIEPDEHFRIGSQTKTFIAVAVLKLVEQDKAALDDPVERHLPGVVSGNGHDGNRITVRHLLQHTSGIPANELPRAKPQSDGTYTLESLVEDGLRLAPAGEPGGELHYSNTNYEILGMLIEKLTGRDLHEAVTELVIEPAELARTVFPAPGHRSVPEPLVPGHQGVRIGSFFLWTDATQYEPTRYYYASGGIISTLEDVTAFYQRLFGGSLLSPASLAELEKTIDVGPPESREGYGLGVQRISLPCGGTACGHNGSMIGYFSMTLVTEDGRHAAAMTNAYVRTGVPVTEMYETAKTALCESRS